MIAFTSKFLISSSHMVSTVDEVYYLRRHNIIHYGKGHIVESTVVEGAPVTTSKDIDFIDLSKIVSIIHQENDWFYIEYNTVSGKKRGYVPISSLSIYDYRYNTQTRYSFKNAKVKSSNNVYYTPNSGGLNIGSVTPNEIVILLEQVGEYYFIDFSSTNGTNGNKRGFIEKDVLELLGTPKYEFPIPNSYVSNWMCSSHPLGVDITDLGSNTEIQVIDDGTIDYKYIKYNENGTDYLISYGLYADLTIKSGLLIRYAHLSHYGNDIKRPNIPSMQKSADEVRGDCSISVEKVNATKGDIIGIVGNTGNSYGTHIHLETRINNIYDNPFKYFKLPWCIY